MPFDSSATEPVWRRNAAAELLPPPHAEVAALAEHCIGHDRYGRSYPFTRITRGKLWIEGGHFVANIDGHLSDGELVKLSGHPCDYRLSLVSVREVA